MKKVENYLRAVKQLETAVSAYSSSPTDDLYRDGLIQRFEFTVELAWKSLKEYLEDQGALVQHATPRAVLKDAYAAGMIDDEAGWNKILSARNITSHVYSEETAAEVAAQVCADFFPVFQSLADFYQGNK